MILRQERKLLRRPPLILPASRRNFVGVARAGMTRVKRAPVNFLSLAEIYATSAQADTIASGSYTPATGAGEVMIIVFGRVAGGGHTIPGFTNTIGSVAPSFIVTFNSAATGQMFVWMARWRGAPSGTVSVSTTNAGDWTSMITVGLSLDRACIFGATAIVDHQVPATTTGDQTITSEQADSLGIFGVCTGETAGSITPDATDTYDERYDDRTAGGTDTLASVGTKALGVPGSKTVEADFTSANWACKFVELKAA